IELSGLRGQFSVAKTVKLFHLPGNTVPWFKLLWGKKHIPSHAFLSWMAMNKSLRVKAKLYNL
ncbi:hypothetical protein Csa_018374, partial [Cucumis sativus]